MRKGKIYELESANWMRDKDNFVWDAAPQRAPISCLWYAFGVALTLDTTTGS
jgi:hypothetical protein